MYKEKVKYKDCIIFIRKNGFELYDERYNWKQKYDKTKKYIPRKVRYKRIHKTRRKLIYKVWRKVIRKHGFELYA